MKAIANKFGSVDVLILCTEEDVEADQIDEIESGTRKSSGKLVKATKNLVDVVGEMAKSLGASLEKKLGKLPSEVELEFSMGFSEKVDTWLIGVGGEQKVVLKLKWCAQSPANP